MCVSNVNMSAAACLLGTQLDRRSGVGSAWSGPRPGCSAQIEAADDGGLRPRRRGRKRPAPEGTAAYGERSSGIQLSPDAGVVGMEGGRRGGSSAAQLCREQTTHTTTAGRDGQR